MQTAWLDPWSYATMAMGLIKTPIRSNTFVHIVCIYDNRADKEQAEKAGKHRGLREFSMKHAMIYKVYQIHPSFIKCLSIILHHHPYRAKFFFFHMKYSLSLCVCLSCLFCRLLGLKWHLPLSLRKCQMKRFLTNLMCRREGEWIGVWWWWGKGWMCPSAKMNFPIAVSSAMNK